MKGLSITKNGETVLFANQGTVFAIRGSVIDSLFPQQLPAIFNLIITGDEGKIAIEVITHLASKLVRKVALTPTRVLSLGSVIVDTGQPIRSTDHGQILPGRCQAGCTAPD